MKLMTSALAALMSLVAVGSDAAVTVFTNRTSWNAAVGTFLTENFNALPVTTFAPGINDAGAIDIEIVGVPGLNGIQDASSSFDIDGTHFYRGEINTQPAEEVVAALLFPMPVIGFAADYIRTIDFDKLTVTLGADTVKFSDHFAPPGNGFLGLISSAAFIRADFATEDIGQNEVFGLDNLSFAAAIPEPSSYLLLLVGCGVLVVFQRRRRRFSA